MQAHTQHACARVHAHFPHGLLSPYPFASQATPVACGQIETNQFLVGDAVGHLFLLELQTDKKNQVNRLRRTLLGITSQASAITKLAVRSVNVFL